MRDNTDLTPVPSPDTRRGEFDGANPGGGLGGWGELFMKFGVDLPDGFIDPTV
jgi:hypothetical protein